MGKILDTLRQAAASRVGWPEPVGQGSADPEPSAAPAEEMSYIEVGPNRSMIEASADVLATFPAPTVQERSTLPVTGPHSPLLRTPVSRPAPEEPVAQVPVLQVARTSRLASELVAFHTPESPAARHYDRLLTGLLGAVADQPIHPALLFTAPRKQIGATTVLLNLAITAARQGQRVVVVEANLRRPALAERLDLDGEPGFTDVLSGECSLESALRETDQPGLSALPAGSPTALLACHETLQAFLRQLRDRFDLVLLDGPAWDGRPALTALATACDAVFLVAPTAEGGTAPAGDALRLLPQQGIRLAGCILTGT